MFGFKPEKPQAPTPVNPENHPRDFLKRCRGAPYKTYENPQAAAWEGPVSNRSFEVSHCLALLSLCYDSSVLRHTGLASRIAKAQQAERRICVIGFFHVLMLREATRFIQISTARFSRMVRFWQAVWGTREGAPVLCPVRQPARACLPLIGVEGGRF